MRGQRGAPLADQRLVRIHPRSCGANDGKGAAQVREDGSSPLVRGQRRQGRGPGARGRIIPARAGPTTFCPAIYALKTDHPRSCGANAYYQSRSAHQSGSSPLVRGQRRFYHSTQLYGRIIPARAGPTSPCPLYRPQAPDHPRSCGANAIAGVYDKIHLGSSPLVRGQQANTYGSQTTARIIPARAGPTYRGTTSGGTGSDHPRSCGANGQVRVHFNDAFGSSPLVRGQPHALQGLQVTGRIIPARAGPTHPGYGRTRTWPDHPRSCGANTPAVL